MGAGVLGFIYCASQRTERWGHAALEGQVEFEGGGGLVRVVSECEVILHLFGTAHEALLGRGDA